MRSSNSLGSSSIILGCGCPLTKAQPQSIASLAQYAFHIRGFKSARTPVQCSACNTWELTRAALACRYLWNYIVFDEAHRVKNELSLVGQVKNGSRD